MADNKTLYEIDLRDRDFNRKLSKSDRNFKSFDKNVKQSSSKSGGIGGLASALPMAGLGLAGLAAAAGAATLKVINMGAEMEQTRTAFGVMFGSTEKGNEMLDLMNEFANVTPFTNDQVIKAGKTLKAFAFDAGAIAPTMKILGDVAAGTNSDFAEMATVFGKIKGNGRLMGGELDMLIDRGFNPLNHISEVTGKTIGELRKDMSKGLISFDMVQDSFVAATTEGGQFNNMMEKQSATFGGLVSTIQGKFGALFASGGEGLTSVLKPILKWTISFIDMLPKINLKPLVSAFSLLWKTVKDLLSPITMLFDKMGEGVTMLDFMQAGVNILAGAFRLLSLPIRVAMSAFNGFFEFLDNAMESLEGIGNIFKGLFTMNPADISKGILEFKAGFAKITESIGGFAESEANAFKDIFRTKTLEGGTGIDLAGAMALSNLTGGGPGGADAAAAAKKGKLSGNVAGVSSGGIKNVTINITKLIEEVTFSTTNISDMSKLKEMVTRVLVEASTDATRLI